MLTALLRYGYKMSTANKKVDVRLAIGRNYKLYDKWSLLHITTGIGFGWLVAPLPALIFMAAYEPIEVLVLSPLLARYGIVFGYEAVRNSLSDIFFDAIGITLGAWLLTALALPPFHLL